MTTIMQPPAALYTQQEFKLEPTKLGRMMRLIAPTVVSFYESTGTAAELKAYYDDTIVPWLNGEYAKWVKQQPGAPYPMGIYLVGNILNVFTDTTNYQTWEGIPDADKHLKRMDAEKLKWSQPDAQELSKFPIPQVGSIDQPAA